MIILVSWWCAIIWTVESAVLDPALYLSPSPPITHTSDTIRPEKLWSQSPSDRNTEDLSVVPIELLHSTTHSSATPAGPRSMSTTPISITTAAQLEASTTTEQQESMDKAETFWPSFFNKGRYGSIHVPLTFGLTGTYGRYGSKYGDSNAGVSGSSNATRSVAVGNSYRNSVGLIGSSYASISDDGSLFGVGKSGLAGTGYGLYPGTRIYGGIAVPGWTGWGNGKWGHYGKG